MKTKNKKMKPTTTDNKKEMTAETMKETTTKQEGS
jgi:hypothetical protein